MTPISSWRSPGGNDVYTQEQGRRLFGLVAFGSAVGAIVSAPPWSRSWSIPKNSDPNAVNRMLLVAAGVLVVCAFLTRFLSRAREGGARGPGRIVRSRGPGPLGTDGAFKLVFSQRLPIADRAAHRWSSTL